MLRSRIPKKVMFGLDICNQAPIRKAEFDQIVAVKSPVTDPYREDLYNRRSGVSQAPGSGGVSVGFLLAAAYLLDPDFVTRYETRHLDVNTQRGPSYGATVPMDRKQAPGATPVTMMLGLNYKRVFALYKDKLTRLD